MMRNSRRIRYGVDTEVGVVVSQVTGREGGYAVPVLDFAGMTPENGWEQKWNLEKFSYESIGWQLSRNIVWTRKIPIEVKNEHRRFWGMKPLEVE